MSSVASKVERIEWIDIAKAITILMMIAGHTFSYGTEARNFIFSFHMPLFYILTGYTIRTCHSKEELIHGTIRDFQRIYMPVFYTEIALIAFLVLLDNKPLEEMVYKSFQRIFWAAAIAYDGRPGLGALWFLVVLFWAKFWYRFVNLLFSEENAGIVFLFGILLTFFVSRNYWLGQSLDLVPLVLFYLFIGRLLAQYADWMNKHRNTVMFVSFFVWICTWRSGIYIEIGTRSFPYLLVSILESVAGSICIFQLSKAIAQMPKRKWTIIGKKCLMWTGRNTLIILCVHHLDWFVLRNLPVYDPDNNLYLSILIRVGVVLVITYGLYLLAKIVRYLKKNPTIAAL